MEKLKEKKDNYSFNQFCEDIQIENPDLIKVSIRFEDFQQAIQGIKPSVSDSELKKYEQIKLKFQ